jgi:hypothetical protein
MISDRWQIKGEDDWKIDQVKVGEYLLLDRPSRAADTDIPVLLGAVSTTGYEPNRPLLSETI